MKINTTKIKAEMKRTGKTLEALGKSMKPKASRQGAWYLIRYAKGLRQIEKIAKALDMNARDLIE